MVFYLRVSKREKDMSKCENGQHNLLEIFRSLHSWDGTEKVVRWCDNCGAVVVDIDVDNRISPGAGQKMMFPKNIK